MHYFYSLTYLFLGTAFFLNAQDNTSGNISPSDTEAFLDTSFFGDILENVQEQDAMGTQRIIDTEESVFSPSLSLTTSYNYSSNPLKAEESSPSSLNDGFSANLNLAFNLGVGEYPLGDNILLTPAFSLMQMRTYNDPAKDFGNDMQAFDVDIQVFGFSVPFVLPDDFTLSLGHTYVRPIAFRDDNVINYTNTPSVSLAKNIPLENGDILTLSVGGSYSFSEGDTLEEAIADPVYYQFIEAVMQSSGLDPLSAQPSNLQDSWSHMLNIAYLKPISEQISIMPSYAFSRIQYSKGANTGRQDYVHNLGVNLSYSFSELVNFSLLSNYTWKLSDDPSVQEYEDFIGGIVAGFNYSF